MSHRFGRVLHCQARKPDPKGRKSEMANDKLARRRDIPRLGRVTLATGWVSFFTDVSSEMVYPLLPSFLLSAGASRAMIGLIEGLADGAPAMLRLIAGMVADRVRSRKGLILLGYALSAAAKPCLALAHGTVSVLIVRVLDRLGKGIRTAPRDALIADHADDRNRGHAFGFQRAMDHAGAMLGAVMAFGLLAVFGEQWVPKVVLLAGIPGALAVLTIVMFVTDHPGRRAVSATPLLNRSPVVNIRKLPARFFFYLGAVCLFAMANSSDAFLLLRARDVGCPLASLPLLWGVLHVVKAVVSLGGGWLSDRLGRVPVLMFGWVLYGLVYGLFAWTTQEWVVWTLFGMYGVFAGMTEGAARAVVADLVPEGSRGRAFGLWGLAEGFLLIVSSVVTGWLWDRTGSARLPLLLGAGFSFLWAVYLGVWWRATGRAMKGG